MRKNSGQQMYLVAVKYFVALLRWLGGVFGVARMPPGPWGLPVFGYLPWLNGKPHLKFIELGNKYGGIFSVKLGRERCVILNDWPSVKATLVDQSKEFNGRPPNFIYLSAETTKSIAFSDGPVWNKQRKLGVQALRSVGVGKKSMEERIMTMVHHMLDQLGEYDQKCVAMDKILVNTIVRAHWKIISDIDVTSSEEDLEDMRKSLMVYLHGLRVDNPVSQLPWLRFLPPNGFGHWHFMHHVTRLKQRLRSVANKHYEQDNIDGNDVVDYYLAQIQKDQTATPPYNDLHLMGTFSNMVVASGNTTPTTALWGFLYVTYHQHVQLRLQAEMDAVVGRQRLPTLDDLPFLPYLDALIMEIHRYCSLIPLSLPHYTTETASVGPYVIPKGTTCLQNIYAVHHDPKLWNDPEVFDPQRFIDENGRAKCPPYLMPFSVGARKCIGQALAEAELRLIFGCLLHRYSLSFNPELPQPSLEPVVSFTLMPVHYQVRVVVRDE